jgi:hydroxyethylthiazole kinase-like uncharacterized protein yjeF
MASIPVLTPEQAAAWDRSAEQAGIATATLMETAGRAVVQVLATRYRERLRHGTLVACGAGNNGGDGWVVARVLHRIGVPVWVASVPSSRASPLCGRMAALARTDGVREVTPDGPWPAVGLVIDAILGTGARGAPHGPAAALMERLADLDVPLVAVDGPTGLDLLDGVQHGSLRASLTVTFGGYRRGHLLARDEVGDLVVADIGFPEPDPGWPVLLTDAAARSMIPPLRATAHKGDRGRVVIVGGQAGMTGAARIAARAAFAAGAGLVHVVAPGPAVATVAAAEPDVQTSVQAFDGPLEPATVALLERADAVIVGPGLGRDAGRRAFVTEVFRHARQVVLDADGIVAFHGGVAELALGARGRSLILTPHLGEFRGLMPELAASASVDPWTAASDLSSATGATVLLKGVPTVVTGPGASPITVAAGNPGLATGGSGDTLSGLIGTFLASGLAPAAAGALGAHVMGRAAELAAARLSARSMRPMDVIAACTELWRVWSASGDCRVAAPPVLHELERPRH